MKKNPSLDNKFTKIILTTLLFTSPLLLAQTDSSYLDGQTVCQLTQDSRSTEIGHFIDVPLHYLNVNSTQSSFIEEKTRIYYWTHTPYNSQKPSLIYFVGGPGGSSHTHRLLQLESTWNVIYFDQRGTACSRFSTEAKEFDGTLYSSEYIARDANEIRKILKLDHVSIYGHSYGTVPATLFASLFPEQTRALVLEGVINQGSSEIWKSPHRLKTLQYFYNQLSIDLKSVVEKLTQNDNGFTFGQLSFSLMYADNSLKLIQNYLESMKTYFDNQENQKQNNSSNLPQFNINTHFNEEQLSKAHDYLANSQSNFTVLSCKELSALNSDSYFYYKFEKGLFSFDTNEVENITRVESCKKYGISSTQVKMYDSAKLYLQIPTTYLQGTTDGATEVVQAINHFKTNASKEKQLILKKQGGHSPVIGLLIQSDQEIETNLQTKQHKFYLNLVQQALLGRSIHQELINDLNKTDQFQWTKTSSF